MVQKEGTVGLPKLRTAQYTLRAHVSAMSSPWTGLRPQASDGRISAAAYARTEALSAFSRTFSPTSLRPAAKSPAICILKRQPSHRNPEAYCDYTPALRGPVAPLANLATVHLSARPLPAQRALPRACVPTQPSSERDSIRIGPWRWRPQ